MLKGPRDATAVATTGFTAIDLGGVKLVAAADTIRRLGGKVRVVELVEVGVPTPADKVTRDLRALCPDPPN
ncbi:MAG: hypothetical protein JWO38_7276, partial [Gemmataceae bacterium]|nr:hypothetical protein [Gemmataceae bacterium]